MSNATTLATSTLGFGTSGFSTCFTVTRGLSDDDEVTLDSKCLCLSGPRCLGRISRVNRACVGCLLVPSASSVPALRSAVSSNLCYSPRKQRIFVDEMPPSKPRIERADPAVALAMFPSLEVKEVRDAGISVRARRSHWETRCHSESGTCLQM